MFEITVFGFALLVIYLVSGTYFTPVIAAIITAGMFGAAALVLALMKRTPRAKELALKAGAFVLFGALIFGCGRLNNVHARRGAVQLASVCEAYKVKTGTYPDSFGKLIPEYLKDIPAAKFTVTWAQYRLVDNKIMFVLEPGLLAEGYDLATKKWHIAEVSEMFPRGAE
jgi:hypothetical protein